MAKMKTTVMKAALSGLYHSGAHRLLAPYTQGAGVSSPCTMFVPSLTGQTISRRTAFSK